MGGQPEIRQQSFQAAVTPGVMAATCGSHPPPPQRSGRGDLRKFENSRFS